MLTIDSGEQTTVMQGRPGYEGANIRTWVGFKHLMYLAEEAVLQWFRERGIGPQALYHRHGLGLEVVDSSVQLPAPLEVDDEVTAETVRQRPGRFSVRLYAERDGRGVVVLKGRVSVVLVRETGAAGGEPPPGSLATPVVEEVVGAEPGPGPHHLAPGVTPPEVLAPASSGTFLWSWRARYFHCHFSDRVQHSAYIRALEEVVDRFLEARGISVGRMLEERSWIPVVSRARVRLLADAHMEEVIHTTLVVEEVLKGMAYAARMDCHVRRGETLVPTATARILHGYAVAGGPGAGALAELDGSVVAALGAGRMP